MKVNKQMVYKIYGIDYDPKTGKIFSPIFGWISPLLVNGNAKLGRGVFNWSMLPGTEYYHFDDMGDVQGTCNCDCEGCYAKCGNYNFFSVKRSLAIKTVLARLFPDFVRAAIIAQIHADNIHICRIHVAGDFFSLDYIEMWKLICKACTACIFWTYTKNQDAENAFDNIDNCNVVKSLIPECGLNYGPCKYILDVYNKLVNQGKRVYICKCGIDENQHCFDCQGCSKNDYVLFIEHSTGYNAKADPDFRELFEVIAAQGNY